MYYISEKFISTWHKKSQTLTHCQTYQKNISKIYFILYQKYLSKSLNYLFNQIYQTIKKHSTFSKKKQERKEYFSFKSFNLLYTRWTSLQKPPDNISLIKYIRLSNNFTFTTATYSLNKSVKNSRHSHISYIKKILLKKKKKKKYFLFESVELSHTVEQVCEKLSLNTCNISEKFYILLKRKKIYFLFENTSSRTPLRRASQWKTRDTVSLSRYIRLSRGTWKKLTRFPCLSSK